MRAENAPRRGAGTGRFRRGSVALLALGALLGPAVGSGCQPGFDPPSKVEGLRIFGVEADKPYASGGDSVTFTMTYADGLDPANPRAIQIAWLGGCFDPPGDAYYGCYAQLGATLSAASSLAPGKPLPPELAGMLGVGPAFTLTVPADLVTRRPAPAEGPRYGTAFVFFMACAGKLGPAPEAASGRAGSFPVACFDATGKQLGADSFVPGYTQIYAFEDGRTNANPVLSGITYDGKDLPEDLSKAPIFKACGLTDDERRVQGCSKQDPATACTSYTIKAEVPHDVAELDPSSTAADGSPLHEAVWVDYYADGGELSGDVALLSDATSGYNDDHAVTWLPPSTPGVYSVWAVVHDNRGGTAVGQRFMRVE